VRVLILTNKIPYPPTDGGAIATLNMARGLAKAGADVKILAMSTPKHNSRSYDFPEEILNEIGVIDVYVDTDIKVVRAMSNLLFGKLPYNAERFISESYREELAILLQESFDVVQLEGPYIFPYLDTIKKYHDGIVSYRAHNVEWEIWDRNSAIQSNPIKRLYFKIISDRLKRFETGLLNSIDVIIPITKRDELKLRQMGFKGKSFVASAGFEETSPTSTPIGMEFPSVFHIGGLDWLPNREGITWFLKYCWPLILKELPQLTFYIAGRNAPKQFVKYVSTIPNVVFCGEVEDSGVFMASKALMVVPLLSGGGMRVKIVEGLARRRAIVSTSIGAEGLDLSDGEELAIADAHEVFARKVIEILKDQILFNQMVNKGYEFFYQNLNNRNITAKLFDFYEDMV